MSRAVLNDDSASLPVRILHQLISTVPGRPRAVDVPKIPFALKCYTVTAYVTGIMLLLLVVEMIIKYGFGYEIYAGSPYGVFVPVKRIAFQDVTGVDLSIGVLIAHGWLYVVYLFANFRLWSFMRWPAAKFIQIALGGVVPLMSFIVESIVSKQVKTFLAEREEAAQTPAEAQN